MSFEDQVPYQHETHFWFVESAQQLKAKLDFLFEGTFICTHFHHEQAKNMAGLTDRPDLYSMDVWDEDGRGDQLLPSVGNDIADYLVWEHSNTPLHHIAWWGYVWVGATETWEPVSTQRNTYMRHLHVAVQPQSEDSEEGAPPLPPDGS